jgi:hypothetical protein
MQVSGQQPNLLESILPLRLLLLFLAATVTRLYPPLSLFASIFGLFIWNDGRLLRTATGATEYMCSFLFPFLS